VTNKIIGSKDSYFHLKTTHVHFGNVLWVAFSILPGSLLSVVFMVALQAWLARLGNRSTNGSTAFKNRRGVARTLLE
jgi:hypothetical protein